MIGANGQRYRFLQVHKQVQVYLRKTMDQSEFPASPTKGRDSESSSNNEASLMTSSDRRVVLSKEQAREIFHLKFTHGHQSLHAASVHLAATYKVSSKAIRDIWKGRSWLDATYDMWNDKDRPKRKIIGRPKGKKDSKQRARTSSLKKAIERDEQYSLGNRAFLPGSAQDECNDSQRISHLPSISSLIDPLPNSFCIPRIISGEITSSFYSDPSFGSFAADPPGQSSTALLPHFPTALLPLPHPFLPGLLNSLRVGGNAAAPLRAAAFASALAWPPQGPAPRERR